MSNISKSDVLAEEEPHLVHSTIDKVRVRAKIRYISRRKFKILGDEHRDKYTGNIVDMSDIYYCKYLHNWL
ncbi:MAG: hypothetical protein DLM72_02330 [Candidatus Nitrosopolaris wilkensis]|nr:MAG: hypothetical protein DLM72_02330 [Candidatus Nitrosopolaris wilkensis]